MKIVSLTIRNFRSLHDVSMGDLGDLTVLIGKNSSGKSNLLEALSILFEWFSLTGGSTPGLDEYFWFGRHTTQPIEFILTLRLSEKECEYIFPSEILDWSRKHSKENQRVTVHRNIVNVQGTWRTESLKWDKMPLVKEDSALTPEEAGKELSSIAGVSKEGLEVVTPLLTPQTLSIIHTRLTEKVKTRFKLIPL